MRRELAGSPSYGPLAIVGIGFRARGAAGPEQLWQLLRAGTDVVGTVPPGRWPDVYDPNPLAPGKAVTRWGSFLDDIEGFDWRFFGVSPREARSIDPQHRLLLELAWEAFEDAGMRPETVAGRHAGVFVGIMFNDYGRLHGRDLELIDGYTVPNNTFAYAANRISFFFDLRGPSVAMDGNCSGSLLAFHQACRSVWTGESEFAIAGGVSLIITPDVDISMSKAAALSPTGRCRTWDAKAGGFVRGEGAGLVIVKPLARALADGDRIYCLVLGTAANHCGRGNWIMEPSSAAQEDVIRTACAMAGIEGKDLDYVEIHGTGTPKGDPVEAAAVGNVTAPGRSAERPCRVGSIKTNLGHLDAAAGVAGLVKTALCLHHRELVPSLHYEQPNPEIPLDELKLRVQTRAESWPAPDHGRFAGVTAIGFGGTNAHAVLKGIDAPRPGAREEADCVLPLSARSEEALRALANRYAVRLDDMQGSPSAVHDLCYTAAVRRPHHAFRFAAAGRSAESIAAKLRAFAGAQLAAASPAGSNAEPRKTVFVYPGHGPQWLGMGRDLFEESSVFRQAIETCDALVRRDVGWSVVDELLAAHASSRLDQSDVVQPVLFSVAIAITAIWRSWGIFPDAVVGHSFGEIAAAHVAGALSLDDAVRIVCARGRATRRRDGMGGVAVVELPSGEVRSMLDAYPGLEIGGINTATSTIVTGAIPSLEAFMAEALGRGIFARRVKLGYASHSRDMDVVLDEFASAIEAVAPGPCDISFCSTVRAAIVDGANLDADYWVQNLRRPVRFADAVESLAAAHGLFVEISPHPVLGTPLEQNLKRLGRSTAVVLPSLRRGAKGLEVLDDSLGRIYVEGYDVAWTNRYPEGRIVSTPTYPWRRDRMWVETARNASPGPSAPPHPLVGHHVELSDGETHVYDGVLDEARATFLGDHKVQGAAVLPASAFVEMIAFATASLAGTERLALTDIEFPRALVVSDSAYRLQLVMKSEGGGWRAEVRGRRNVPGEGWRTHAKARVERLDPGAPAESLPSDVFGESSTTKLLRDECYAKLREVGLDYGETFRGIEWLRRRGTDVRARVRLLETLDAAPYLFHPAFHDACLHVSPLAESCAGRAGFIPVRIGRIVLCARPAATLLSHARVVAAGNRMRADVELRTEDGTLVQIVEGIELAPLDNAATGEAAESTSWLYDLDWEALPPLPATTGLPANDTAASRAAWLILADARGVGAELAAQTRAAGRDVIVITAGDVYAELGPTEFQVHPLRAEDLQRALARVQQRGASVGGVVHLWSLDLPSVDAVEPDRVDDVLLSTCGSAVALLQALDRHWEGSTIPTWFVTRAAQAFGLGAAPMSPLQAPLWGFARSIAHEIPSRWGGLIDLDPSASESSCARALSGALAAARSGEDELVIRNGNAYGARLRRRMEEPTDASELGLSPRAAYLVTGGTGGLGLAVAGWLAQRGAKHIVLAARTPLPPPDEWDDLAADSREANIVRAIRAIEAAGADVRTAAFDCADPNAVSRYLEEHAALGLPPIRGLFHLAGTVAFEDLLALDAARLLSPVRPKIHGTLALHRLLTDLDHFVVFSSASALIRSPRLGHYAAANAFLDALVHYRRARRLPATTINWGLWADVGYIDRLAKGRGPAAIRGIKAIQPAVGIQLLERILRNQNAQTLVWPSDWDEWAVLYPAFARTPLVAGLLRQRAQGPAPDDQRAQLDLEEVPAPQRRATLLDYAANQIATYLRLPKETVPADLPLDQLGFDSLLATELQARIRQDLGVQIPVVRFLGAATIHTISDVIWERLSLDSTLPSAPPSAPPRADHLEDEAQRKLSATEAKRLSAELDRLSGPSLDALFARLEADGVDVPN